MALIFHPFEFKRLVHSFNFRFFQNTSVDLKKIFEKNERRHSSMTNLYTAPFTTELASEHQDHKEITKKHALAVLFTTKLSQSLMTCWGTDTLRFLTCCLLNQLNCTRRHYKYMVFDPSVVQIMSELSWCKLGSYTIYINQKYSRRTAAKYCKFEFKI